MKKPLIFLLLAVLASTLAADPVTPTAALDAAAGYFALRGLAFQPIQTRELSSPDRVLAYVYELIPAGYAVVSADTDLPPVLAYSFENSFGAADDGLLAELLTADIPLRLAQLTAAQRRQNRLAWASPQSGRDPFQQWPPEGSSATGGWIKTTWTQNSPYNDFCPLDPVSGNRSVAGCPSIAMGQIANYHQTINGTVFTDADDYFHNLTGRNYWIDDDALTLDFPAWAELNARLDTLMTCYKYGVEQTDADKAALVWACGVAAKQVYSSSGSGTFAVAQAFDAFERFGFEGMELLTESAPDLYGRMAQNMMDALPVHLAVVTPAWDSGHNVVVDGYNTDNFFHINYGWGGMYDGWYLLPSQIPSGFTVIEGAIVDIQPRQYLFSLQDSLVFDTWSALTEGLTAELINISSVPVQLEAVNAYPSQIGQHNLLLTVVPGLVAVQPGQSVYIHLCWNPVESWPRELVQGRLEVIHSFGVFNLPMIVDTEAFNVGAPSDVQTPPLPARAWPNPFAGRLNLKAEDGRELDVTIYNVKGQRVAKLSGPGSLTWDALDDQGQPVPNGIYLLKMAEGERQRWLRTVKLR